MSTIVETAESRETLADLLDRLGGISPERVRLRPAPGTATEADVLAAMRGGNSPCCELIDGVLVEKAVGFTESLLASLLITVIDSFVRPRNLGLVTGEQGGMRLFSGRIRYPDVGFTSWDRLPGRCVPAAPIPDLAPDLAIEVLSVSNTPGEMRLKRQDFFAAGTRLMWQVDPRARTVGVYTDPETVTVLGEADTLDGSPVLPGFTLSLRVLFAEQDRHG